MWYAFTAWNEEAHYGWTQNPAVAEAVLGTLNAGKSDVHQYGMTELGEGEDVTDGCGTRLQDRENHICTDETTLDEVLEHRAAMEAA